MVEEEGRGERSLAETPTWAVATVITVMVALGFSFHTSLKQFGKWLDRTKRKCLHAALEKIKEELMVFGVLSVLMGPLIIFVAKICINSELFTSNFYPCSPKTDMETTEHILVSSSHHPNKSVKTRPHNYCPEGRESLASYESLEQLHRFLFVLTITHVSYSFIAIALAMIKIYSWKTWENQAKLTAMQKLQGSPAETSNNIRMRRLSTFISHRTYHPWSQHRVLVWVLCFIRQIWSSISRADYMALRLGFITTHELPLSYDFHNYMLRSMEEEFRDIVGISVPLWIYAIFCIFLDFNGTNIYFWLSFLPAILILVIGTKLHRIVVKLAVEIMDTCPLMGTHQFKLRDDLFWFGKPKLLLLLIQFISFQNAFEMATFIWSLWEIKEASCFMDNRKFLIIRLIFGVISQCWCSFITFPLYVIITQMGSRYKRTVVSENVRTSLHEWTRRVKAKQTSTFTLVSTTSTTSLESLEDETCKIRASSTERSSSTFGDTSVSHRPSSIEVPRCSVSAYDSYGIYSEDHDTIDLKDSSCLLPPP